MKTDNNTSQYTKFFVREVTTLLPFIINALNGISRNKAKSILTNGGVRVNQRIIKKHDYNLSEGMCVEILKRKPQDTIKSKYIKIIYEDQDIIVIEKQPGILSMGTPHHTFCVKTLLDEYFRHSKQKCTAHVVHRLDRETSGLLLFAKKIEIQQFLIKNWQEITSKRSYIALCAGTPSPAKGTIRSWLTENKAFFIYSSPTDNGGKLAITHYETLESNGQYSLVEFNLETGRKNQIRVHCQSIMCPICGDEKYGNGENPINRLALHAYRLHFYHPTTKKLLQFETDIPYNFKAPFANKTQKADT